VTAITAGGLFTPIVGHTCALTTAGGVQCWGNNSNGQLGNDGATNSAVPVGVVSLSSGVTAISAGGEHTCALTTEGGVLCWGSNSNGQLGDGSLVDSPLPVPVAGLTSGVLAISAGSYHTCAMTTGGGVQCWGEGNYGQLGNGAMSDSQVPVSVIGLSAAVAWLSSGDLHNCVVTSNGAAQCWGYGGYGQLGNDTTDTVSTPVDVQGFGSGTATIACGSAHTCAVTRGGAASCWGYDVHGGLGDNATTNSIVPVGVFGLSAGAASMATGWGHSCVLTTTGAVKCWGYDVYGQLGDASTVEQLAPVPVTGLSTGVQAIAAGYYHSCALTTAGSVQCWGSNIDGQLGNGSTTDSDVPVAVLEP
jgi:alpha-tubulin suppressor-like RCC1 family protein